MLDSPWIRLANNWLHDVGTGLWAACLVVLLVISGERPSFEAISSPDGYALIAGVTTTVFLMLVAALAVIALTGAFRLFYWRSQTPSDELASKRPALIWKHVAFVAVYVPGTWWAWTLVWPAS
jgi:uncharacterized membrane protein